MDRRKFLGLGVGAAISGGTAALWRSSAGRESEDGSGVPPAFSVIPVVGDGKWIWTAPPQGQTGYLEPRSYLLNVGIEIVGQGSSSQIKATTPVPIPCPEQRIDEERIESRGCEAQIREIAPDARQLYLAAPEIGPGQTISAVAHCKLTISKQFHNYQRDQFPEEQKIPNDVRRTYLGDSPGIQSRSKEVRQLLEKLTGDTTHPWELARKFASWIPRNIRPQIGPFTGVSAALENRLGDCAEMSAVFVALSRAAGIPARLVWVPDHNWSEFYLTDKQGQGHWIPAHTACYFWFGWTGVHELVLQKGDRLRLPERGGKLYRLQEDWMQWLGRRPTVRYLAELTPQPARPGEDPGPGARRKIASGEWKLTGSHPLDRYARR
jgi:transglutaminase-like putative cysteine protease